MSSRAALLVLVIASLPSICRGAQHEPYNVLIVVLDTVRADHVSANGYSRKTTPAIDALAAEGANFRSAITVAPRTWQSFASILTGLYPPHHKVRYIYDEPLHADVPTLSTILSAKGYDTGAFDVVPFVKGITGGRGFADYIDLTRRLTPAEKAAAAPPPPGLALTPDSVVMGAVWDWINARRTKPSLAFVRLIAGHRPYLATPEQMADFDSCAGHDHSFNDGVGLVGMTLSRKKYEGLVLSDEDRYRRFFYEPGYSPETIHHMIAHYDAALRNTDAAIGSVITRLRDADLLRRTIVVITADHGEAFGETGYFTHGPKLDDAAMRVPLVIRLPDDFPGAKRGLVIGDLVRVVDIAPTVLDALAIEPPRPLDGVSLLPALTGGTVPTLWAYAETEKSFVGVDPDAHIEGVAGRQRMAQDRDWKLLMVPKNDGAEYRLYDLRKDPEQTTDVCSFHPTETAVSLQRLRPILAADSDAKEKKEPVLTDGQKEQLRALGYR